MGSTEDLPPLSSSSEEITVLVTGFAPFRTQHPINPSYEIASRLPPFLPPSSTSPSLPRIRILVHPSPIRVSYTTVRNLIPTLWEGRKIDYCIHIGMASGRKFYSIERRAHRSGYRMADVDNCYLADESLRQAGKRWEWEDMPEELETSIEVEDVWKRWREGCKEDVRISEDAGRYLCDFIYFSSLTEVERKGESRRVLFLHVPVESGEGDIRKGVDIMVALVRSVVESGLERKGKGKGEVENGIGKEGKV